MSELRNRYDRGAVSGRIVQPPFAELVDRARRRVRRTRMVRLAGVAVLAALVAVPLMAIQGGGGSAPPAQFPQGQFPSELATAADLRMDMEFYDSRHGFATYQGDDCDRSWISVTRDGGVTWSEMRELPQLSEQAMSQLLSLDPSGGDLCFRPTVIPIAEETLVMLGRWELQIRYDWDVPPVTAYISHDAGESWREYQPEVTTADTVPDGVTVGRHCQDEACERAGMGWYDPDSGDRMVLGGSPAVLPGLSRQPISAADGSIWVTALDRDGALRVLVSRDRGRSWQDRTPDQLGAVHVGASAVATSDGQTAYVWAPPSAGPETAALHRTTDGGETWQQLPAGAPFTAVEHMRVALDGTLVVTELYPGTEYVSGDGGETFHATDQRLSAVRRLPEGWCGFEPGDSNENPIYGYLSRDGLAWQLVPVPIP